MGQQEDERKWKIKILIEKIRRHDKRSFPRCITLLTMNISLIQIKTVKILFSVIKKIKKKREIKLLSKNKGEKYRDYP